ncbi:hypothetical protein TURU_169188 [Turdus rufiventris]|nr:hypothetical protein TURU_169188 [Turdus rufiventris]
MLEPPGSDARDPLRVENVLSSSPAPAPNPVQPGLSAEKKVVQLLHYSMILGEGARVLKIEEQEGEEILSGIEMPGQGQLAQASPESMASFLSLEGREQIPQESCGFPIPGSVQSQVG